MRIVVILIIFLIFSCRSVQYVPVETVRTEKEYVDRLRRDSVYVYDSVFVFMKGDTVFRDRWHTVYKDRFFRDTVFFDRMDSVRVPYPVEKPLSKWQDLKLQTGGFTITALVVVVFIVVGRMVYKLRR